MFDFNPLHPVPDAQQSSWRRDPAVPAGRGSTPWPCLLSPGAACPDRETQTALPAWGMLLGIPPKWYLGKKTVKMGICWHDTEVGFPPPDVGGRCKPGCAPVPMVLVWGFFLARAAAVLCMQRSPGMGRGVCPCSALPVLLLWPACFHLCSQH